MPQVVIRIDVLDLHAPAGSPAVCLGYASLGLFRDVVSGRALTLEQGAGFEAAMAEAEETARRAKLDDQEAERLMPRLSVACGGWQIPLRSVWPLRGLWTQGAAAAGGAGGAGLQVYVSDPAAGAQAALNRFVGEDVAAWVAAARKGQQNSAKHRAKGGPAEADAAAVPLRLKLARELVGDGARDGVALAQRLDGVGPLLLQDLPRLPCASLLLRVLVNPTEADMMDVLKHAGHASLLDEIDLRARDLARKQQAVADEAADVDEEEAVVRQEELVMRAGSNVLGLKHLCLCLWLPPWPPLPLPPVRRAVVVGVVLSGV